MKPAGIINVGNSCYLSSVLQLLASSGEDLADHFEGTSAVGKELSALLTEINVTKKRTVNPERFIRSFAADGLSPEQQDAHEFLLALLNMQSTSNKLRRKSAGMKDLESGNCDFKLFKERDIFTGILLNEIICLPCASKRKIRHISSLRVEPFSCVTLVIEEPVGTINEAVYRQLCVPERIGDYVNYEVGGKRCGLGAFNQKTPLLLPKLLFLHVSLLTSPGSPLKSSVPLESQVELSGPGYRYHLLAVIVHFGATGRAGHFVCYRRDNRKDKKNDGRWSECNDSLVRPVTEEEVLKLRPYILLYETAV